MAQHDPLRTDDPRQVGPYTLLERLGAGGMGVVYLARDRDGRRVAVKIPGDPGRDHQIPQVHERFVAEVATHRTLTSERVVRFLDANVHASPPWVALEYVQGANLSQVVAETGVFRDRFLLALAAELAEAVADIHSHGIVHRDLHPSNVICLPNGIKVIDFGLARVQADDEGHITQGPPIGVPGFMAPERFTGVVSQACDVFAWGCCVAYAAAGTSPFPNVAPRDAYAAVMDSPPVLTGLPADLADLIAWALAMKPADRPPASRVAAELKGLGVAATRPAARPWPAQALPLISRAVPDPATGGADGWITSPSSEDAPSGRPGAGGVLVAAIGAALCLLGLALAAGGYAAGDVTGPVGAGLVATAAGVLAFVRVGGRAGSVAPLASVAAGSVAGGVFGLLLARGLWAGSPRAAAASELVLACCFAAAFTLYLRPGVRSPGGSGGTPW
jgi:serine/threonine protein kinase